MAGVTLSVLLLVAGVVAMLALHILIVFWALRRGITLRAAASRQDEERAAEGLSAEDLDGLPCHDHEGKPAAGGECAVCLEAFRAGDVLVHLPCAHRFHWSCGVPWVQAALRCPVCRALVHLASCPPPN